VDVAALLLELYGRIGPLAEEAVEGLDAEQLAREPKAGANTIAWLVWHIARVQDHHIAELLDDSQLWVAGEWADRMRLERDARNTGYGHSAAQVATIRPPDGTVLLDYFDAVSARTRTLLESLAPEDLDRIVDRRWDPPVTLGVRLVSVADDGLQHAGQAAYVRGLLGY
jgi:uncharacterized damage-inducible protein DinB